MSDFIWFALFVIFVVVAMGWYMGVVPLPHFF